MTSRLFGQRWIEMEPERRHRWFFVLLAELLAILAVCCVVVWVASEDVLAVLAVALVTVPSFGVVLYRMVWRADTRRPGWRFYLGWSIYGLIICVGLAAASMVSAD